MSEQSEFLKIQKPATKINISFDGFSIEAELHVDGDQFGILIGEDLQSGCAVFALTIPQAVDKFKTAVMNHPVKIFGRR